MAHLVARIISLTRAGSLRKGNSFTSIRSLSIRRLFLKVKERKSVKTSTRTSEGERRALEEYLYLNGAEVDILNNKGDTSLHRAAYTNTVDVVTLVIEKVADVSNKSDEGNLPKQMTKNEEIIRLIEAAEQHEAIKLEEEFMSSVRLGQVDKVDQT